ncbi:MAG: DUF4276 family protein [Actinobacteria bacterium]|nr:DUF4276 family protein [Actinomycetota bacterium]
MRIGFIVDGDAEYASLRLLFAQLEAATANTLLGPVVAKFHPEAPYGTIARASLPKIKLLEAKGADRVVLLLDRERREACSGEISHGLATALGPRCRSDLHVVVKDRQFENWLLSDLRAFRTQGGRFRVSKRIQGDVEPNKADHVQASELIRRMVQRGNYDKVNDSKRILGRADVARMAAHSRSFRRFLRCLDYPRYSSQSVKP